eukprot:Seg1514.2 transcript_id=Seg1514.2/GoldUCD/mRNA.D3Y31 product="hypothetical protein" protein_id=Seg1514.2/GoldUCD/D3Y31
MLTKGNMDHNLEILWYKACDILQVYVISLVVILPPLPFQLASRNIKLWKTEVSMKMLVGWETYWMKILLAGNIKNGNFLPQGSSVMSNYSVFPYYIYLYMN